MTELIVDDAVRDTNVHTATFNTDSDKEENLRVVNDLDQNMKVKIEATDVLDDAKDDLVETQAYQTVNAGAVLDLQDTTPHEVYKLSYGTADAVSVAPASGTLKIRRYPPRPAP